MAKRKILVLELWGLGDLTFSTVLLQGALKEGDEVHLVGKSHAQPLLEPTFPSMRFFSFEAGWTKFQRKYRIWNWNWRAFLSLLWQLRKEHYDVAVSARDDPRDHLLMALIGARKRIGFAHCGSGFFLTHRVERTHGPTQHKVEDWRDLGATLGLPGMREAQPRLRHDAYRSIRVDTLFRELTQPVLVLHAGARIPVRRWPVAYFEEMILRLRQEFNFHLILIPDPDGYGSSLASLADTVLNDLTLAELIDVLGRADLLLSNDSGPAHLAAACQRPTLTLFGPTCANWFRPWGEIHHLFLRDFCRYRPCFDYCHFAEPYCLTRLRPEIIWPEVCAQIHHLVARGILPAGIVGGSCEPFLPEKPLVVLITATYRRAEHLARMLASLEPEVTPMAVLVVDNADDPATAAVVEQARARLEITRLVPGKNLSCGGGLALGEQVALERYGKRMSHLWLMDDDICMAPGALDRLLAAMRREGAALACPMITFPNGEIGWFPGLLEAPPFDALRKMEIRTPEAYLERFGAKAVPFSWATGVSLLVTRETLEAVGLHRTDFQIRGEDFEFSLRISFKHKAIFVPDARLTHYCFSGPFTPEAIAAERKKQIAMLHNVAYIACRLPHGLRILRCLPGNLWRHCKNWGPGGLPEGLLAYWKGGVLGHPAGHGLPAAAAEPAKHDAKPNKLKIVYSLADQNFATTKSLGILNLSTSLAKTLATSDRIAPLTLLSNSSIPCKWPEKSARVLLFNWVLRNKVTRTLWDQWCIYQAVKTSPEDWLFLPKGFASFLSKPPCHLAVYVHDAMIFHYAVHHPGGMKRGEIVYFNTALKATIRHADVIFTNSQFTRSEVQRFAELHALTAPPVVVAGIGFSAPTRQPVVKKNQVLFLASQWPHKLTSLAIEYADRWQRETNYEGEVQWIGFVSKPAVLSQHKGWVHHARIPEEPFRRILSESRVLVFFSEYEGFGMPPVEATIAHTCPVYSNIPAAAEVMDGKGFSFENDDYCSFAKAMEQALHCDEATIDGWSQSLLETHRWEKVAATVTNTLERLS